LEAENELANKTVFQDSSHKFMSTIMTSGTLEDKVSALTLAIQESPLHTVKTFENLLGLAKKKSRNHALMALAALKDLLSQGAVLPPDRKLRYFGKQPGLITALQGVSAWTKQHPLPGGIQEVHLLAWAYEDWLKKTYFDMIQILEGWCNDELPYSRTRALSYIWELLKERPEQEENLLRLLVNKLGDKEKKVASKTSYLLLQLENAHPNMKETITSSIESDVLFRPGQNLSAKHYAMITLNQTVLSTREQGLARKLLDVYFGVFKALLQSDKPIQPTGPNGQDISGQKLNKKARKRIQDQEDARQAEEQSREKLIAQVLAGINRAFPFAELSTATFDTQLDTLYRITHSSNFNTGVQAMILIQMITQTKQVTADRYYRTLYESLLDPRLMTSSKQVMYMNLLYKSLKSDLSVKRVQAFVKRIIQILPYHEASFICSAIYLVSEIAKTVPSIGTMLSDPELLDEDEEEHFVDAPEDGDEQAVAKKPTNGARQSSVYDARKRDPLHANADRSCLWELVPLLGHFHPSVSLFASRLLFSDKMPEKPDPTLHTLIHFLDRFVYRNAKAKGPGMRGVSIMQPLAGTDASDLLIKERSGAARENPLNTEAFWAKRVEDVAADEVFFHQYFNQSTKKTKSKKSADEDDGELEGIDSGDEDEIWKALVDSRPEIEGDSEDDGFSDMENLMGDDDEDEDDMDLDGQDDDDEEVELNLDSDEEEGGVALNFDSDEEEGGVKLNLESEAESESDGSGEEEGDKDDDDDAFDIGELESDDDAFVGSDEDLPSDIEVPGSSKTGTNGKKEKEKSHKQKLKSLPLYASAEDYAKLIGDSDEE
jgi:ribosome biogenesis protein MAK21